MGANTHVQLTTYKLVTKVVTSDVPSESKGFVTKVQTFVKDKSIGFGTINFVKAEETTDGISGKPFYNIFVSTGDTFYVDNSGYENLRRALV